MREAEDDLALIARVARGDSSPLRELYARHAGMALAICLRVLRDRADAEDAVQATFVDVWRRAPQYRPGQGSVEAWIFIIARTRAIDLQRSRASQSRSVLGSANEAPVPGPETPEESFGRARDSQRVRAAMEALPDEQRAVIELAWFSGLSHADIATQTGAPLGTVKTRARLALEKLAALLRDAGGGVE